MPEKTDCVYYKERRVEDKSVHGTIATPVEIIKIPYCSHRQIGDRLGNLPCEKCQYYEKRN